MVRRKAAAPIVNEDELDEVTEAPSVDDDVDDDDDDDDDFDDNDDLEDDDEAPGAATDLWDDDEEDEIEAGAGHQDDRAGDDSIRTFGSAESIDIPSGASKLRVTYLAHGIIHPDPDQPRTDADDELKASIKKRGILQPILVRPHPGIIGDWMIVDGERRWRGAAGVLAELPTLVRDDQEDDVTRMLTQLTANTGKQLTPIQEADKFRWLLERTRGSVQELADVLGRPRSTVAERISLLDLGPWVALIEVGQVPLSHAVRVLLPYRTAPATVHQNVIDACENDYRWEKRGRGEGAKGMSIGDFESIVGRYYRPFCYPLNKVGGYGSGKNPEFNTSAHDRECECGAPSIAIGYSDSKRRVCVNPAWWGPLHRAAKKKKTKRSGAGSGTGGTSAPKFRLELPGGAAVMSIDPYSAPRGCTVLTDDNGHWAPVSSITGGDPFDPADLVLNDKKLVRVKRAGVEYVATKDAAAVKAARAQYALKIAAVEKTARDVFATKLAKAVPDVQVAGAGVAILLQLVNVHEFADGIVEVARAQRIDVPSEILRSRSWSRADMLPRWLPKLGAKDAEQLATGLAAVVSRSIALPAGVAREQTTALQAEIRKKPSPWRATGKPTTTPPKAKPAKKKVKGGR